MSTSASHGFWVTNRLANPALRRLLRGPGGRRLGRRLAVLRYVGRRTGEPRELVVQYAREGRHVWVVPGQPERKRWWRNMIEARDVDVWLEGRHLQGVARVIGGGDGAGEAAEALAAYSAVFPRTAGASVIVRIDLGDACAITTSSHAIRRRTPASETRQMVHRAAPVRLAQSGA